VLTPTPVLGRPCSERVAAWELVALVATELLGVWVGPDGDEICTSAPLPVETLAWVEATGVCACTLALGPEGVELAWTEAEATGVWALAEALVWLGETAALAWVEAAGVWVLTEAEAAGGSVWTLALTVAEAAGVEAVALVVTDGDVLTLVEAETEVVGVETETFALGTAGAPGKPSAWAGNAKDRHQSEPASKTNKNRKRRLRMMSSHL
jgi:hypothetical protein